MVNPPEEDKAGDIIPLYCKTIKTLFPGFFFMPVVPTIKCNICSQRVVAYSSNSTVPILCFFWGTATPKAEAWPPPVNAARRECRYVEVKDMSRSADSEISRNRISFSKAATCFLEENEHPSFVPLFAYIWLPSLNQILKCSSDTAVSINKSFIIICLLKSEQSLTSKFLNNKIVYRSTANAVAGSL